jgi:hypothetical protein
MESKMKNLIDLVTDQNAIDWYESTEKLAYLCDLTGYKVDDVRIKILEDALEDRIVELIS